MLYTLCVQPYVNEPHWLISEISVAHFHFWPFHALVLRISQLLSSFNSNKRVVTIHKAVFLNLGVPFSSHTENINVLWEGTQNIFHLIYLAVECPPSSYGSYSSEHCNRPTVLISKIQLSARWHNYLQKLTVPISSCTYFQLLGCQGEEFICEAHAPKQESLVKVTLRSAARPRWALARLSPGTCISSGTLKSHLSSTSITLVIHLFLCNSHVVHLWVTRSVRCPVNAS